MRRVPSVRGVDAIAVTTPIGAAGSGGTEARRNAIGDTRITGSIGERRLEIGDIAGSVAIITATATDIAD